MFYVASIAGSICGLRLLTIYIYIIAIDCGFISAPANGQVLPINGTTVGSVATFNCSPGYVLSPQQAIATCGTDGLWSPSPACQYGNC